MSHIRIKMQNILYLGKVNCKSKETDYFLVCILHVIYQLFIILAYVAKPGNFTEIAYFKWYSKTNRTKKRGKKDDQCAVTDVMLN